MAERNIPVWTKATMRKERNMIVRVLVAILGLCAAGSATAQGATANPLRDAYFGNLHVHTAWSFDANINGAIAGPDDAYRWAKGEAIPGGEGTPDLKILRVFRR